MSARPGVVLVLPSFAGGGAERVSLSLIAGLAPGAGSVMILNPQGPLRSLVPTGDARPRNWQAAAAPSVASTAALGCGKLGRMW